MAKSLKDRQIAALTDLLESHRQQYADKCLEVITLKATWKCFHCGFETTDKAAAEAHFGDGEGESALCIFWYSMEDADRAQAYQEVIGELNQERKENIALTAGLKSLTEAYNNTDWKKLTDEQKEIINNLTVRWGKVIRENAELIAVKDRQNDFINKVEMAYPEFYEHHREALRGGGEG